MPNRLLSAPEAGNHLDIVVVFEALKALSRRIVANILGWEPRNSTNNPEQRSHQSLDREDLEDSRSGFFKNRSCSCNDRALGMMRAIGKRQSRTYYELQDVKSCVVLLIGHVASQMLKMLV